MVQKLFKLFLIVCVFSVQGVLAQSKIVSGIVTDAKDGTPLPGVAVVVKGTTKGVSSDFDGKYSIKVSEEKSILLFTSIGYRPFEASVSGLTTINVKLEEGAEMLGEVVVTALGITREKKSLGYAVTELKSDEITTIKDNNIANSLVGKVAGIVINQSGSLGSGSRITIRGNNTITGNNQALIVVDGVPINTSGSESGGSIYESSVTGGGITDINPDDIESVSVLKGPNAAALYGSRAASGVLLITTKKGSKLKGLGISINSNTTFESVMFLPKYQNKYGQGTNGAATVPDSKPTDGDYSLSGSSWGAKLDGSQQLYFTGETVKKPYIPQPNNVRNFFTTGFKTINSIGLQKAWEKSSVRFSYTRNETSSIIPNSTLNSHNFNVRTVFDLSDKLTVDTKATYFTQELNNRVSLGSEGLLAYVYSMPRNIITSDLENNLQGKNLSYDVIKRESTYDVISYRGIRTSTGNPYWMLNRDRNEERRNRFLGFAKINYKFNNWLSAFVRVGGDITRVNEEKVRQVGHHFTRFGSIYLSSSSNLEFNTDFLVTVKKDITNSLNFVANIGGNLSKRTREGITNRGSDFKIPTRSFLANTYKKEPTRHIPLGIKKINSLYGSFSFSYDNFMYLDITARNDWTSTLNKNNRSYFYPSVSYSLLVNRFIDPDKKALNYLKLRGSWAQVGNDTGLYQLTEKFDIDSQGYLGQITLSFPNVKLKKDLKPEHITSSELGIESRMFNNRFYTNLSVYKITTTDMIFDIPAPTGSVYKKLRENIGKVENKGIEFLIGGVPFKNDNFSWDVSFNFSKNKNKLVELIPGIKNTTLNGLGGVSVRAEVGGSIGDIYATTWKKDDKGNKLVSKNGRPLASRKREFLGNVQPDWIGGITNTLTYKNYSFKFLIDGRIGGKMYSATSSRLDGSGVSERSLKYREEGVVVNAINEGTKAANTKKITAQEYWGSFSSIAENYVYDQTNVRLREIALSYNFPKEVLGKTGINAASVSFIGRNLFFFLKKAEDVDPDSTLGTGLSGQGISLNSLPTSRSLGFSINLKF